MDKNTILENFCHDQYTQIFCDKCMDTFLTNIYEYDDQHVLLEKRGLGLEYFCHALQKYHLSHIPMIDRIGVLDESGNIQAVSVGKELFTQTETELRYIYIMEKLVHLDAADEAFFNHNTQNLELHSIETKNQIFQNIQQHYGQTLASDIIDLCHYFRQHEHYIAWDLHADNLMKRSQTGEIVILDPYAVKV